jgi:hypothetical protein
MTNLIIITSVIKTHPSPLSYGKRSVFSEQERYEQTLKTIESCNKIPDSTIVFLETSDLGQTYEDAIESKVNTYINSRDVAHVRKYTDGASKGKAESTQIRYGLDQINWRSYDNLFKISGRYWLNDNFKYQNYYNDGNVFKQGPNGNVGTALYKVNKRSYDLLWDCLTHCTLSQLQMESVFGRFFNNNYIALDKQGLCGYVSVDGNFIDW